MFGRTFFRTAERSQRLTRSARVAGCVGAAAGVTAFSVSVASADESVHPPAYTWTHNKPWQAYDTASIRRGFHVYKEVCASCHSLDRIAWRNLVGVAFTEEEAKALAEQEEYEDGPDDHGEMFMRPGRLTDYLPPPYANEQQARDTNNGALPPDLSLIVKARHSGEDYVFALLTGYRDPPPGIVVRDAQYYNPYFAGGKTSMAQALHDGMIDYEDGTEASISQMAKDVAVFLAWASKPEQDERHRMGLKAMALMSLLVLPALYWKRSRWAVLKHRKLAFKK